MRIKPPFSSTFTLQTRSGHEPYAAENTEKEREMQKGSSLAAKEDEDTQAKETTSGKHSFAGAKSVDCCPPYFLEQ